MNILIAVPSYRCEKQIRRVLSGLAEMRPQISEVSKVVVFDNQSPDATFSEAEEQIKQDQSSSWISLQRNPENVGLGGTHKIAFSFAKQNQFSHIIIFHGDDQGDVRDIPKVIDGLKKGFDAVLGSRFMKGSERPGYSLIRVVGNRVLNAAYSLLTLTRIEDLGSGLNGFRVEVLDPQSYQKFSNQFTFNMDLILYLIEKRVRMSFVPITWREEDQVSNAQTFEVGWQTLKLLLAWRFKARNG